MTLCDACFAYKIYMTCPHVSRPIVSGMVGFLASVIEGSVDSIHIYM